MATIGIRMMFHNRVKFAGTLVGVIFAVFLVDQQSGAGLGILERNVMYVEHAHADLWVVPVGTRTVQAGKPIQDVAITQARALPQVRWAEPVVYGGATLALPSGSIQPITVVGTAAPAWHGGPFNVVSGDLAALEEPDAMVFEDSDREKFGGINLGSVREVNGHRVKAVGFTWGAVPFGTGGSYAFTDVGLARELLGVPTDQLTFAMIGVAPGSDLRAVRQTLQDRIPNVSVLTDEEFRASITHFLFFETPVGVTLATSMVIAIIVGFLVVGLMMFSTVIDNLREFGTLKAMGATTFDLVRLLWVQAAVYGAFGTGIGLTLVMQASSATRKPTLAIQMPPTLMLITLIGALLMCITASSFAAFRIRSLEPAMVFR